MDSLRSSWVRILVQTFRFGRVRRIPGKEGNAPGLSLSLRDGATSGVAVEYPLRESLTLEVLEATLFVMAQTGPPALARTRLILCL